MKRLFLLAVFTFSMSFSAQTKSELRHQMHLALESKPASDMFLTKMKNDTLPENEGYKGMAYLVACKHTKNPFTRLSYFNQGKKHLDQAIERGQQAVELRMYRYQTQKELPALLGYDNRAEDLKFLRAHAAKETDAEVRRLVLEYLKTIN